MMSLYEPSGLVILGALILGEELYETGLLATIIRLGDRGSSAPPLAASTPTSRAS